MTTDLILKADAHVEFAVGKVTAGKEAWMFGEYFPAVAPMMAEYGYSQLASFAILATNTVGVKPDSGVFSSWPSAEQRAGWHNDPRVKKYLPERDASMDVLLGGNLFQSMDEVITVNTDADYAVIIAKENPLDSAPIFDLPLRGDSPRQAYSGKTITLRPWSDAAEQLLSAAPGEAEVFRIRFNPPAS